MTRRTTTLLALVALVLAACGGGGGFDRDEAIDDFVESGLTEEQAACVVDALVEEFGEDTLGSDAEPTEEQTSRAIELSTECVFGGGDDASGEGAEGDAAAGEAGDVSGGDTGGDLFTLNDLAPACRGNGVAGATAFEPGGGTSLVVVLAGEAPDFSYRSAGLPDGWESDFDTIADTELVACLDRVAATPVELCDGYESDGTEWSVQTHDSTYEVTVRAATTAEVLASATLEAPADGCPVVSSFSEGDPNPVPDYELPVAELELLLAELVTGQAPAEAPAATEAPTATEAPVDGGGDAGGEPQDYGDDPELDALWDACEAGDGEACDDLYFQSPIGSRYEDFGNRCGDRFPDGSQLCALEDLG